MSRDGRLVVVTGRSRSGKSERVLSRVKDARRVLVYDPKAKPGEWPGLHQVHSMASLARTLQRAGAGPGRYRLLDPRCRQFDLWCRAVLSWARTFGPCAAVADELAAVTHPGKAPESWGQLCRTGLGFGIDIYAITHRPAESDKTCFSNASEFVCFSMSRANDRQYMAREMDIDQAIIDALDFDRYQHVARIPGRPPRIEPPVSK